MSVNVVVSGIRPRSGQTGQSFGTVAAASCPNSSGSIPSTVLYFVNPTEAGRPGSSGMYAVYCDLLVTQAGTGGTVVVSVSWNNGVTAAGFDSQAFSLAAQGEQAALLGSFLAAENTFVSFSTTVSGVSGSPLYNLNLRLQFLG